MNVNFVFPPALLPSYSVSASGLAPVTLTPTNGVVSADVRLMEALLSAGFTLAPGVGTTASRPTVGLYTGQYYFDTSLGIPIWRNAANTLWVNATGSTV
jgi:hypothetical protein